jgi:hypothetical protein
VVAGTAELGSAERTNAFIPCTNLLKDGRLRRFLVSADVIALQLAIKGGATDTKHLAG